MKKKVINIINICVVYLVVASCLLQETDATKYVVKNLAQNTPGGQMFDQEIGVNFTLKLMPTIKNLIYRVFQQKRRRDRNHIPVVNVFISDFQGFGYKNGNSVNISAPGIYEFFYPRNMSKTYFTSLLTHEMTHVYQWHGNFTAPGWLTEGTADYVMVKSNIYEKDKYPKPGEGKSVDQGYGVTERFLEYCDSLLSGFTAKLNKKMRYKYSDVYWVELLGKPVDQLWREYKAKYGNLP